MTGLEKILDGIAGDAQTRAEEIIAAANDKARQIIDEALSEAGAQCAKIVDDTREQAELIGRISKSGSELGGRKLMLKTRREVLDETLAMALKKLKGLPAEEYFAVLERLAVKYAQPGKGELVLSGGDKARLPGGFLERVNATLTGGSLTLAQDSAEIDGGFILRYGGIEENCTFYALAEQRRDSISDELGRLLFG